MRVLSRPKIGLFVESSRSYGRDLLRGISDFARTRTNWSLLHQEMSIDAGLPNWWQNSSLSGVIARVDTHTILPLRALNVPIVDVRCRRLFENIPQIETNDREVARLAFTHLWERGFRRFAFCGFQNAHYSENRLRHFQEFASESRCPFASYQSPGSIDKTLTDIEQTGLADVDQMSAWLRSLKVPTGLFVCNDIRGQHVLNLCQNLEIAVPDDLAVIGVDDDDAICPLSDPPLSSIRPDAHRVGFRAAETLKRMLEGNTQIAPVELVNPARVVQRLSTQVNAIDDREISRVCRIIREHACEGIKVRDVVEYTNLSRRQLERRFRNLLNRSIHEEITATQIARVQQLLRETTLTLEQIAPLAGYRHKERLCAVFKRAIGHTPGEYRNNHKHLEPLNSRKSP
ncbi:Xylose operon regulatory protein [Thalassoglobus neptunius]|uniref:Xylose operon regulatory protein n=1 Tax=Thalassoglobus neptunius TaxID=1938619 RepID=A0A5C5W6V9_9PLAN|nr:DNA-binding transcriptional regulator [Thalassoglobus neptunius]TWT46344.1 Xylose operon regulatory protein [Thalassoglobus neptunius]